ncbi:MAG TPA: hypothetical protein VKA84_16200 [Gemmatimonadaceae bacterium]|nr:hypothetical protein [Gemmatimonadaceae bacterium]
MSARRLAPLLAVAALAGCAYFNGVYNAKEAQRSADKQARSGADGQAQGQYRMAAEKAETVLARYPRSRWRADALYLAGRGHAFSGQCDQGVPRLSEFLAMPGRDADHRERATLALGSCLVQQKKYSDARSVLEPLTESREREVSLAAALWAARASMALGDNGSAQRYLSRVDAAAAQWELAASSIERGEYARAESLLTIRAARGDYRDELLGHLGQLWAAGRQRSVEKLVDAYAASRQRATVKARLHMYIADLDMAADRDSLARAHLAAARRLSTDPAVDREAVARLALIGARDAATSAELGEVLSRAEKDARGSELLARLQDSYQLMRRLETRTDPTGASLFLAAEVARDSLHAKRLAHALLHSVEGVAPTSVVTPKALLAAALLRPDSAPAYTQRVRANFPYVFSDDIPGGTSPLRQADEILRDVWALVSSEHAQEVARQRAAASAQNGTSSAPPPGGP